MLDFLIQSAGMILLLWGLWLMGDKRLIGPAMAGIAELITTYVGIKHHVWSIIVIGVVLCFVQARNFWKWRQEGVAW